MIARLVLSLTIPALLAAQGTSTRSAYLALPNHARVEAMGQSLVADDSSFESSSVNPASYLQAGESRGVFTHVQWVQDVSSQWVALSVPVRYGALGLSIATATVADIPVREIPGPSIGTFSSRFAAFQAGFAIEAVSRVALGVQARYIYEKIYVDESTGLAMDAGIIYRPPWEGISLGVALANLGSMSAFRSEAGSLPRRLTVGGQYSTTWEDLVLIGAAAVTRNLVLQADGVRLGGEATYNNALTGRMGYQSGIEGRNWTFGVGFRYAFVLIDYAVVPFTSGLGTGHIISVGVSL